MKLSIGEFEAMQMPWRKWWIEKIEFNNFKNFGMDIKDRSVLEVGCGSGYAATLLTKENPQKYCGIDIMPEQVKLANERGLINASFNVGDASDLKEFEAESVDAIFDFCILHHVEGWRKFFEDSHRLLRNGGSIYIADLSKRCIHITDFFLHWNHAEECLFTFRELENQAKKCGFEISGKKNYLGLEAIYRFRKI